MSAGSAGFSRCLSNKQHFLAPSRGSWGIPRANEIYYPSGKSWSCPGALLAVGAKEGAQEDLNQMPGPPQLAPLGAPHPVSKADPASLWRKLVSATCILFFWSLSKAHEGLEHRWTAYRTADSAPNCLPNSCSIFLSPVNMTRRKSFARGRGHPPKQEGQSTESWHQTFIRTASHIWSQEVTKWRSQQNNIICNKQRCNSEIPELETLISCLWISQTGSETRGNPGWEGLWLCAEYTNTLWLYRNWITGSPIILQQDMVVRPLNTCRLAGQTPINPLSKPTRVKEMVHCHVVPPESKVTTISQNLHLSLVLHQHYWFAIGWSECNQCNLKDILSINKCEKCDLGNIITVDATLFPHFSV